VETLRTSPSSGQAATRCLLNHPMLSACHSGAALGKIKRHHPLHTRIQFSISNNRSVLYMIQHIEYKRAFTTDELHFSGGLRGELIPSSIIKIHPLRNNKFSADDASKITLGSLLDGENIIMLGVNEKIKISGSSDVTNIWHPSQKDKILSAASSLDLWEFVAYQAENSGYSDYANCARYISVSLRLAGLRLRDISDHYHEQLNWAIADKKPSNKWFTNLALPVTFRKGVIP